MKIDYIKGSREDFLKFVDSIADGERVGVFIDIDVDGLSSGVFLEQILLAEKKNVVMVEFLDRGNDMVKEVSVKIEDAGITKAFFCDMGIDSIDFEGFKSLREEIGVFLIDHHPMNEEVKDWDNIIKTTSDDCSAMVCFFLGEDIIDFDEWKWLCCSAIFSDYSYKAKKNMDYIQSVYPDVTIDNISSTVPGLNGRKINSAIIYYDDNKKYVYDLVKHRDLDKIEEIHNILEDEIERLIENFSNNAEHYDERGLHFHEIDSKFKVLSTVTSLVSKMKPEHSFVFMQRRQGVMKFSARNQGNTEDVAALMKKCVAGLEDASGGGHKAAAAAKIKERDLDIFKKRLLE
ncbi:MAG: DHHA1 domain-containing protein [Nanoarchaeota archaeon]|jgi:single-stranded DNA-specific DHH superfamily exonuclease|nr:DHHA1 domain-containing protein [Nanoarchaeota archaeon]